MDSSEFQTHQSKRAGYLKMLLYCQWKHCWQTKWIPVMKALATPRSPNSSLCVSNCDFCPHAFPPIVPLLGSHRSSLLNSADTHCGLGCWGCPPASTSCEHYFSLLHFSSTNFKNRFPIFTRLSTDFYSLGIVLSVLLPVEFWRQ